MLTIPCKSVRLTGKVPKMTTKTRICKLPHEAGIETTIDFRNGTGLTMEFDLWASIEESVLNDDREILIHESYYIHKKKTALTLWSSDRNETPIHMFNHNNNTWYDGNKVQPLRV